MRAAAMAFAVLAWFVLPARGQLPGSFDHFATGFPLTGAHGRVDCAACHVNGRFKGTPQQCASCHNGALAQGKINQHPRTSDLCEQCHLTNDWKEVRVDHAGITGDCASCHNGTIAVGKPVDHPPTNASCETCHKNMVSFAGATFDHAGISSACASCHNGSAAVGLSTPPHVPTGKLECSNCHNSTASWTSYTMNHAAAGAIACSACHNGAFISQGRSGAQTKGAGHIATTADCSSCHASTASWAGATFNHAGITGGCAACHNNATATGLMTPPHIPTGVLECSNCHRNTTSWTSYTMNHAAASAMACSTCHNGAFTSQGKSGAQTKGAGHVATAADCSTCHTSTTSWVGATFNHAGVTSGCAACHNNSAATGLMTPPHIPVGMLECSRCHSSTVSWTNYAMNHAAASAIACSACHNGGFISQGTSGAQTKGAGHVATTAECSTCHASTTSWTSATFNHAGVTSGCAACHNGTAALGKPANHIPTGAPCETCHKSTVTFAGALTNHAGITGNCASCHNGVAAPGKPATHIQTTAPCESCHKSSVTFAGARMDHGRVTAPCASCHNGVTAEGKPERHFVTNLPCESCHRVAGWNLVTYRHVSPRFPNHGGPLDCQGCHGANTQTVQWKFPAYQPDCAACHASDFRPPAHLKFRKPIPVYYTVAELRDCTGACHVYADSSLRTIVTRRPGEHRANRGGW